MSWLCLSDTRDWATLAIRVRGLAQITFGNHSTPFGRLHSHFWNKISQHIKSMKMRIYAPRWMCSTTALVPKNRTCILVRTNLRATILGYYELVCACKKDEPKTQDICLIRKQMYLSTFGPLPSAIIRGSNMPE